MGNGETILIADDEPNLRTTLAAIMRKAGFVVTTAESAGEALSCLEDLCFDLVILDLKMPLWSEKDLLAEIRCRRPALPVIILNPWNANDTTPSSLDEPETVLYLLKPIDPAKIVDCTQELVNKTRSIKRQGATAKDIIKHKLV